jgi:hypothetical protein
MTYKLTKTSQPADPYYGAVSLLLHGDNLLDSSVNPKTLTAYGDAAVSTAQSKFNGASLAFDGTEDFISTNTSADLRMGTDEFTIEFWFYPTSTANDQYLLTSATGAQAWSTMGFTFFTTGTGKIECKSSGGGSAKSVTGASTNSFTVNAWNHVAAVKNVAAGRYYLYLNGVRNGGLTIAFSGNQLEPFTIDPYVTAGGFGSGWNFGSRFNGYIDDIRITKGVCRYTTATFTPPTQPFKTLSENFGIVNDNSLKLYLDVGNDTSYVGSGTTWNDLSGLRADLGLKGNFNTGTISTGIVTSFVGVATALGNIGITTTEITGINTTSVDIDQTLKEFSGIIGSGKIVTSIGISTVYINPATLNTDTLVAEISFGSYISATSIGATFGNLFNDRYLNFDGESNYVYGSTAPLANATQGTIGAWINTFNFVYNFIDVVTVFFVDVGITTTEITGITTTGINVGDYLKPTIDVIGYGTTVTSIGIGTVYINPATSNASSLTNAVLSFGYYSGGHIYGESLPGSDTYWAQLRLDNGYPSLIIDDDDVLPSAASTIRVDDGLWHYVAATGDGTNWSFYVDGVYNSPTFSQGDGTYWFNDASGLTTYTIGALDRINKTNYFNGKIAQVHVYDRALSQSEILQNYNAHQSRFLGNYGIIIDGLVLNLDAGDFESYPGSGTTWYDLSGNGNNGTLAGGVGFDSHYAGSLTFDGVNDYAPIGTSGFPFGNSAGTLSCWARTNTTAAGYHWIVSYGNQGISQSRFLGINGNTYYFGGYANDITASGVPVNTWINMVGVYDGTNASMYVNGVLVSGPTAKSWNTVANNAQVGRQTNGVEYWSGNIAQVSIYNKALTTSEVQQNFNALRGRYGI